MSTGDAAEDSEDIFGTIVPSSHAGERLDKALAALCPDFSRSRLQGLIEGGSLLVNGVVCTDTKRKVKEGDELDLTLPEPEDSTPQPENIPLDIVYEDEDVIVLDKPAGLVVHPAPGNYTGTLVNALLYHCGDTLSGINGVKRPGIVHRLDKDTSGLMIVAKNDHAHTALSAQLQDRSLSRVYTALVLGVPNPLKATLDTMMGRHPTQRLKMSTQTRQGKKAITHYQVRQVFHDTLSLVECRLATGRTHQIRVHMESIGHPLIGDPLYGAQQTVVQSRLRKGGYDEASIGLISGFGRQALHATELTFIHPSTQQPVTLRAPLPEDFNRLISIS